MGAYSDDGGDGLGGLPAGTGIVMVTGGVGGLAVAGTDYVAPDVAIASGKKLIVDASTSLTSCPIQRGGDPNTGISFPDGADSCSIVTGGAEIVRFNTAAAATGITLLGNVVVNTGKKLTMTAGRLLKAMGASVAAAATLTLGTDGNLFAITGNTNVDFITTTNWQAGAEITLQFSGTPTVNHNTGSPPGSTAAILLAGAANFAATANDVLTLIYNGTNWVEKARTVI